jgi:hypothetical protein
MLTGLYPSSHGMMPPNNFALAHILGILPAPEEYIQDYSKSDLGVKVI